MSCEHRPRREDMSIDLREIHETSTSSLTFISTLSLWSKSGYFYSVVSKLDKAEYAALIHAHVSV